MLNVKERVMRSINERVMLGMKLHEDFEVHEELIIMRVPGGWIYKIIEIGGETDYDKCPTVRAAVFVPEPAYR